MIWRKSKDKGPRTGGQHRKVAGVESRRGRLGNKVRMTEEEKGDHLDSR